jgi:endogenous inhibitor of DNA gyrase (YacG/DUF329 family)
VRSGMADAISSPCCPICKRAVKPRAENGAFPFCSPRCKQVELGKWLNEEYRLPAEEEDDGSGEGSSQGSPGES